MMRTQISLNSTTTIGAFVLALLLVACGSQDDGAATDPAADSPEPPGRGSVAAGSGPARSVEDVDVCAQIPAADVAAILGSTPERTSAKATRGRYASDCTYTADRDQGMHRYAMIWVYPAELWDRSSDSKPVPDLGDEAFLEQDAAFANLKVLAGGLFLETRADTPEQARALADLALARVE